MNCIESVRNYTLVTEASATTDGHRNNKPAVVFAYAIYRVADNHRMFRFSDLHLARKTLSWLDAYVNQGVPIEAKAP